MRIQKDNIVIRSATSDDAVQLNQWWNDGKIMGDVGFPNGLGEPLEDTIKNIKSRDSELNQLCIIEIDSKPIGEFSYTVKTDNAAYPGWKICDRDYQNKGYGSKIIQMTLEYLFSDESINSKISVEKIIWDTMLENKRAQHVYENKIGAGKVGIKKDCWKDQLGNLRSGVDYEISREEFSNAR